MAFLALIHLLLILFVFNKDTPMQLIAESSTDTATEELHKIYADNDLRVTIYRQVQSIVPYIFIGGIFASSLWILMNYFATSAFMATIIMLFITMSMNFINTVAQALLVEDSKEGNEKVPKYNNNKTLKNKIGRASCRERVSSPV